MVCGYATLKWTLGKGGGKGVIAGAIEGGSVRSGVVPEMEVGVFGVESGEPLQQRHALGFPPAHVFLSQHQ